MAICQQSEQCDKHCYLVYAISSFKVLSKAFRCVRSMPCDALTPGPIRAPLMSLPPLSALETSDP